MCVCGNSRALSRSPFMLGGLEAFGDRGFVAIRVGFQEMYMMLIVASRGNHIADTAAFRG